MFSPSFIPVIKRINAKGQPVEVAIQYKNQPYLLRVLPGQNTTAIGIDDLGPVLLAKKGIGKSELLFSILTGLEEICTVLSQYEETQKSSRQAPAPGGSFETGEITLEGQNIQYRIDRSHRRKRIQFSEQHGNLVFHVPSSLTGEALKDVILRNSSAVLTFFNKIRHPIAESPKLSLKRIGQDCFLVTEDALIKVITERSRRKAVSVSMSDAQTAVLKVPLRASKVEAIEWLRTKSKWLCQQRERLLRAVEETGSLSQAICSADASLCLLGTERKIVWVDLPREQGVSEEAVRLMRVATGEDLQKTRARLIALIKKWALPKIEKKVKAKVLQMGRGRYPLRKVFLTAAKSRWGSCTSAGDIRIHWNAVFITEEELDYLITHEVAHLHEMNHSPRFWAKVEAYCPNYKELQKRLKKRSIIPT